MRSVDIPLVNWRIGLDLTSDVGPPVRLAAVDLPPAAWWLIHSGPRVGRDVGAALGNRVSDATWNELTGSHDDLPLDENGDAEEHARRWRHARQGAMMGRHLLVHRASGLVHLYDRSGDELDDPVTSVRNSGEVYDLRRVGADELVPLALHFDEVAAMLERGLSQPRPVTAWTHGTVAAFAVRETAGCVWAAPTRMPHRTAPGRPLWGAPPAPLIDALVGALVDGPRDRQLADIPESSALLELAPVLRPAAVKELLSAIGDIPLPDGTWGVQAEAAVALVELAGQVPLGDTVLATLVDVVAGLVWRSSETAHRLRLGALLAVCEQRVGGGPASPALATALANLRDGLVAGAEWLRIDKRGPARRAHAMGAVAEIGADARTLGRAVLDAPEDLVVRVVGLAETATASRPTVRFLARRDQMLQETGVDRVRALVTDLIVAGAAAGAHHHGGLLRGLVWIGEAVGGDELAAALADMAVRGWSPFRGHLSYAPKPAHAAVLALTRLPEGRRHLGRLELEVTWPPRAEQLIDGALAEAAAADGVSIEQLIEPWVSDLGLVAGRVEQPLGDDVAVIAVDPQGAVRLTLRRPDGTVLRSVPHEVTDVHHGEIEVLRRHVRLIRRRLAEAERRLVGQRDDGSVRDPAAWRRDLWDHGLVGPLARRLVWQGKTAQGWRSFAEIDGRLIGPDGRPVRLQLDRLRRVRIWRRHAVSDAERVAWHETLNRARITQPFGQV